MTAKLKQATEYAKQQMQARRQLLTYAAIGILGLWVDLGGFYLLYNVFGVEKNLANFISQAVAILHNFVLNARFNFKKQDNLWRRLVSFYAVGTVGILITSTLFWIFTDNLGVSANIIKPIAMIIVFVTQYNLNRLISFR
jgi:putative flippase GtrA